ncbi:hypothetical protein HanPI659440_Chr09g0355851 [Helianthus annuus]|nr:hypothetical protein HanPI659440_Chr09g0355851 [Helianthus annuus]
MWAYNVANKSQNPNFHYLHTKPVTVFLPGKPPPSTHEDVTEQQPFFLPGKPPPSSTHPSFLP